MLFLNQLGICNNDDVQQFGHKVSLFTVRTHSSTKESRHASSTAIVIFRMEIISLCATLCAARIMHVVTWLHMSYVQHEDWVECKQAGDEAVDDICAVWFRYGRFGAFKESEVDSEQCGRLRPVLRLLLTLSTHLWRGGSCGPWTLGATLSQQVYDFRPAYFSMSEISNI